jgi:hypothetical protein
LNTYADNDFLTVRTGFSVAFWWAWFFVVLLSFVTANPIETAASFFVVPFLIKLMWRKGEPPILLFVVFFKWLQVTTKVFHADVLDVKLVEMFGSEQILSAFWLSLICLVSLSLGIYSFSRKIPRSNPHDYFQSLLLLRLKPIFILYSVALITSVFSNNIIWGFPQLTQVLKTIIGLKWALYFIITAYVFTQKANYKVLVLITIIELFVGFIGFFSVFKKTLFVLTISMLTVSHRFKFKTKINLVLLSFVSIILVLIWTEIKVPYRTFLNQGTLTQNVLVPVEERVLKFVELTSEVEIENLYDNFEILSKRIAYIDFFAYAMRTVPSLKPFANGEIWGSIFIHILTPRILFPDKPKLVSDSDLTNEYTELSVAGGDKGSSIGLGYFAQSYIDFGPFLMFLPIFLVGMLMGFIYKYAISNSGSLVFGYSFVVCFLVDFYQIEIDRVKLVGGLVTNLIFMVLLIKFVLPHVKKYFFNQRSES